MSKSQRDKLGCPVSHLGVTNKSARRGVSRKRHKEDFVLSCSRTACQTVSSLFPVSKRLVDCTYTLMHLYSASRWKMSEVEYGYSTGCIQLPRMVNGVKLSLGPPTPPRVTVLPSLLCVTTILSQNMFKKKL